MTRHVSAYSVNKGANALTSFRPVVARTALAEYKVVRAEEVAERAGADIVHGARLEVDEHGAGHVLVCANFVIVNVDALQLEVGRALVDTITLDPVLLRDNFPELGSCERNAVVSGWYDRSGDQRVSYRSGCRTEKTRQQGHEEFKEHLNIPGRSGDGQFHACWSGKQVSGLPCKVERCETRTSTRALGNGSCSGTRRMASRTSKLTLVVREGVWRWEEDEEGGQHETTKTCRVGSRVRLWAPLQMPRVINFIVQPHASYSRGSLPIATTPPRTSRRGLFRNNVAIKRKDPIKSAASIWLQFGPMLYL